MMYWTCHITPPLLYSGLGLALPKVWAVEEFIFTRILDLGFHQYTENDNQAPCSSVNPWLRVYQSTWQSLGRDLGVYPLSISWDEFGCLVLTHGDGNGCPAERCLLRWTSIGINEDCRFISGQCQTIVGKTSDRRIHLLSSGKQLLQQTTLNLNKRTSKHRIIQNNKKQKKTHGVKSAGVS